MTGDFLDGTTIGNGTYKSTTLIFGGGFTGSLDQRVDRISGGLPLSWLGQRPKMR